MFAKKTVDGVLATFSKAVDDLRQIHQAKTAEAARIEVKIGELQVDKADAQVESMRALKIADNISKLISA